MWGERGSVGCERELCGVREGVVWGERGNSVVAEKVGSSVG